MGGKVKEYHGARFLLVALGTSDPSGDWGELCFQMGQVCINHDSFPGWKLKGLGQAPRAREAHNVSSFRAWTEDPTYYTNSFQPLPDR